MKTRNRRLVYRGLLGLFSLLLAPGVIAAADFAAGADAYRRGDFARAARIWEAPASRGDTDAQFGMGMICSREPRVWDCNAADGFDWYARAAVAGHRLAQFNLGMAYRLGRGTAADEERAAYWFAKAAEHGLSSMQYYADLDDSERLRLLSSKDEPEKTLPMEARTDDASGAADTAAGSHDDVIAGAPAPGETALASAATKAAHSDDHAPHIATLAPNVPTDAQLEQDRLWFAERDPEHFTIQIATGPRSLGPRPLRRDDSAGLAVRVICLSERCYALLGDFATRELASASIKELPQRARRRKPWPRKFGFYTTETPGPVDSMR